MDKLLVSLYPVNESWTFQQGGLMHLEGVEGRDLSQFELQTDFCNQIYTIYHKSGTIHIPKKMSIHNRSKLPQCTFKQTGGQSVRFRHGFNSEKQPEECRLSPGEGHTGKGWCRAQR